MQNFSKFEAIILYSNIVQVLFVDGADAVFPREDAVSREDAPYNIQVTIYVFGKRERTQIHDTSHTVTSRP